MFNGLNNKLANVPTITGLSDITSDSVTSSSVDTDSLTVNGVDVTGVINQVPINTADIAGLKQITTGQTYSSVGDTTTFDNNMNITGTLTLNNNLILTTPATTLTQTELSCLDGVSSNIQTQLTSLQQVTTGQTYVSAGDTTTFNNNVTITGSLIGSLTGLASRATSIDGGIQYQIPYQSNVSTTSFISNGSAGQFLQSNGILSAPSWASPIIPATPTLSQVLVAGNSAGITNINMNSQSITNATAITATTFNGALTGLASQATSVNITTKNDAVTYYPIFATVTAGVKDLYFDDNAGSLSYIPSTNSLTATTFVGTASNASQILVNNIDDATTYYPTFATTASGQKSLYFDITTTPLTYIPSTSTLSATNFTAVTNVTTPNILSLTSITPSNGKSVLFNGTPIGNGGNTSSVCMGTNAGPAGTIPNNNFCFGTNSGTNLTTGVQNLCIGPNSGNQLGAGRNNTFLGGSAGRKTTSGTYNTQIGSQTQSFPDENLTGSYNTTIGADCYILSDGLSYSTAIGAGVVAQTSSTVQIGRATDNTIFDGTVNVVGRATFDENNILVSAGAVNIGCGAGSASNLICGNTNAKNPVFTTGGNTVLGSLAGNNMTIAAANNTYVGSSCGSSATNSVQNTCIGGGAGSGIVSGLGANVFIGYLSGFQTPAVGTGTNNTCVGTLSGTAMINTAASNVMVGSLAGWKVTNGARNVLIGGLAGDDITSGNDNTCVGNSAGTAILTGLRNTVIGASSGTTITGNDNICIGSGAAVPSAAGSNQIAIGRTSETMYIQGGFNYQVLNIIATGPINFPFPQFFTLTLGAAATLTLPAVNIAHRGAVLKFKRNTGAFLVTFTTGGALVFKAFNSVGAFTATATLPAANFYTDFICDGSGWYQLTRI